MTSLKLVLFVLDCCRDMGVSDKCLSACSGSTIIDLEDCSSDILKVLQCAAGRLSSKYVTSTDSFYSHYHVNEWCD